MDARIASVVIDLALDREFDYQIPDTLADTARVGSRVRVPFGASSRLGYIVARKGLSSHATLKPIAEILGERPLISDKVLKLARWMASYYCAPVEHAVRTVLPGAVRKESARFKSELAATLVDACVAELDREALRRRAPKQADALKMLEAESPLALARISEACGAGSQVLRAMEKKGLVTIAARGAERRPGGGRNVVPTEAMDLMDEQAAALVAINASIETREPGVVLLHGVTGSGKTEVYLQAIAHARTRGQGAIVLVPEISLTPQTVERFVARFGEAVAVLHSHLSEGERHDEWHRILQGKADIVIGARSAVFAPIENLGLIVVDEEHEPSYKQEDPPRYNARDVAVMRGHIEDCAVVLGSATPALESLRNARSGKYAYAPMLYRVDHRKMPEMRVVDMRVEAEATGHVGIYSRLLVESIRKRLDAAEQTMLFLNRRGFASHLMCPKCGYVGECDDCSVSMTYHRHDERLRCHMCAAERAVPARCPGCNDPEYKMSGMGTQRVEDVARKLFPRANIERMDADTTRGKDAYDRILGAFRQGKIDILIGTQMIAKGLHFPNVTLIGVIYADMSLHMPDFRAGERTFQLLTQVAGRAGRGDVEGEVVVQTYTPFHPAVQFARRLDYDGFYDQEVEFRKELLYPPAAHLVMVTVRGLSEERVKFCSELLAKGVGSRIEPGVMLGGAAPAPILKAKRVYRYQLMLRAVRVRSMTGPLIEAIREVTWPKDVTWSIDVDAVNLL